MLINDITNIIFVIDSSGSMDNSEYIKELKGIIEQINSQNEIGIITFNEKGNIILEMSKMNNKGKEKAKNILDEIILYGKTNIISGIIKTFELLDTINNSNKTKIILITDGGDNISNELINKLDEYKNINNNFILNVFGIGYNINSKLLKIIADKYKGIFKYIDKYNNIKAEILNYINNNSIKIAENIELLNKLKELVKNDEITYKLYDKYMNEIEDEKIRVSILNNNYKQYGIHYILSRISELEKI
jgi:hypothetical protein